MAKMSRDVIKIAFKGFFTKDLIYAAEVSRIEDTIDKLQHDITLYLSKIANERLPDHLSRRLYKQALLKSILMEVSNRIKKLTGLNLQN